MRPMRQGADAQREFRSLLSGERLLPKEPEQPAKSVQVRAGGDRAMIPDAYSPDFLKVAPSLRADAELSHAPSEYQR